MTNKETKIVGLECEQCGQKKSLKVDKKDARIQDKIRYICKHLDGPSDRGCGEMTTHTVVHIYGEPATSRLRELNY